MPRPRINPEGTHLEAFSLWPETMAVVKNWMDTHGMNKSEALRAILLASPPPTARAAKRATKTIQQVVATTRQASLPEWERAKRAAEKRVRRATAARKRRAAERAAAVRTTKAV